MKYIPYLLIPVAALFFCPAVSGEGRQCHGMPTEYVADLDLDGLSDTVRYHAADGELIFILSGKNYTAERYPGQNFYNNPDVNDERTIDIYNGGFSITMHHMRADSFEDYRYRDGVFILNSFRYEHIRYGTMNYDEGSRLFRGDWWYRDADGEFVVMPPALLTLDAPVMWGEAPDMEERGVGLFEYYRSVYLPEVTRTVVFAGTGMDQTEDFATLYYYTSDGQMGAYGTIYCNYGPLEPGQSIEVTTGTHLYIEPGDGSWRAVRGVVSIKPSGLDSPQTEARFIENLRGPVRRVATKTYVLSTDGQTYTVPDLRYEGSNHLAECIKDRVTALQVNL